MNETKINWTELSWNPASGCNEVSKACDRCYAKVIAEKYRGTPAFPNGFDVMVRPWKLNEPAKVKRPSLIFTNSMTDMFHLGISDDYRDKICDVMRAHPQHRYQVLTKRPAVAEKFFRTREVPSSMWLGCTVEEQATTWRIDVLRRIAAPVRFLSCEPIYSPLLVDLTGIDWVIGGGESGGHLSSPNTTDLDERALVRRGLKGEAKWMPREDRVDWIRQLRDDTVRARAAFYWKQWGGPKPESGGRLIDGRTWDDMPTKLGALPEAYDHLARSKKHQVVLPVIQPGETAVIS